MSFTLKGKVYRIAKEYLFVSIIVLFLGVAGVLLPYLYGHIDNANAAGEWDGSLSSIDWSSSNAYTKLIYANNQYNYFFTGYENGEYRIEFTTSTNGADGTWSDTSYTMDEAIRPSIDEDLSWPIYDIQYNTSSAYFGMTYYVSSTDVMIFTTSSDGVIWGSQVPIYTYDGEVGGEWLIDIDFLEGTGLISIGYEFDKVAFSTDAGANWSSTTITAVNSSTDDLIGTGITAGPVLHAVYKNPDSGAFYYASSTNEGTTWATTTIHNTTNGSSPSLNKFIIDDNGRPGLLISDTQQGQDGSPNYATSTMYFASRNDNGTWTTSTIGSNSYSYIDDTAFADMGFYGSKPYMVYYGTNNYVDFAYSTSTASPFTFVLGQDMDLGNVVGEMSRMSTTYDSANTTAAVAYVTATGTLRFVTSSVDLVNELSVLEPPSNLTAAPSTTTQIDLSWDAVSGATSYVLYSSTNNFSTTSTVTTTALTSYSHTGLTASTQYYYKVATLNEVGTGTPSASVNTTTLAEAEWDGSLSSITDTVSSTWTRLIYANSQYNYFYTGLEDGNYYINLTTSTNGVDGTWSDTVWASDDPIRPIIDGGQLWPIFDIQYNASSSYFGMTYYVSSTDVIVFVTSTDGVTWGDAVPIYDDDDSGDEYIYNIDFLEGTDDIIIGYEFDKVAYSSDAGASWNSSTMSFVGDDDSVGVSIDSDQVLHAIVKTTNGAIFSYATSSNWGVAWSNTTTVYDATGTTLPLNKFAVDGNGRPSLLLADNTESFGSSVTSTMYFVSLEDGIWTTSTIGEISYTFDKDPVYSDMGFYGAKPYMAYLGTSNYVDFAYSTSTESEFVFDVTQDLDDSSAIGENSRMSTTYDSANTTAAVAYVTDTGTLRFATSSVDLVGAPTVPTAPIPSGGTMGVTTATLEWGDVDDETGYIIESSLDGVTYTVVTTTAADVTTYAYIGLIPNTVYWNKMAAFNTSGTSTYTEWGGDDSTTSNPAVPTSPTASTTGQTSMVFSWGANSNPGTTVYDVWYSGDSFASSLATTTDVTYTATGLATSTSYTFKVRAQYLSSSTLYTSFSDTSEAVSTFDVAPTAPDTFTGSAGVTTATIGWVDNSDNETGFIIETSSDGVTYTTVTTTGANVEEYNYTGLTPNTFSWDRLAAFNTYGTSTYLSWGGSAPYATNPAVPTTLAASASGQTSIVLTWGANSNPGTTVYDVRYSGDSYASSLTTTTAVTYTATGLTAGTSYTFKVRAQYLSDSDTYTSYSDTASATTEAVPVPTPVSSGGAAPASPPPPAPSVVAPATVSIVVVPNTPQTISVGNTSHTVTVGTPSANGQVTITIQSDPITITLKPGEEQLVDTDRDNKDDIFVRYNSLDGDRVNLTISAIEDLEFSINQALSTTDKQLVTLYFNSPDASLVAISNSADFANASFVTYTKIKQWTLTPGNGLKTVYVKFRTTQGGTREVLDTITLTSQAIDQVEVPVVSTGECDLTPFQAYKHSQSNSVYYITPECTKRAFSRSDVFFTYFGSWDDVGLITKEKLDSIPNDTLGFMPWGPNYDPKYGALVKIVTDPKVYLLLNTEKYWITSESVFNSLNYHWNWIEDIDKRLLNKYTIGSEITYTDHHPNYTLVKYKNNNKVYRLEPDPNDNTKQVRRWIPDETTFNSLNFRWDRIVTIPDTEVYETGSDLGATTEISEASDFVFTSFLSLGSSGDEVKQLQIRLQELGYLDSSITPNGNFGSYTTDAVIKLQQENNLIPALGYVGPGTREVLNGR